MANSIRTSTVSPTSFANSPSHSPEPEDDSSLPLVNAHSLPVSSNTARIRKSRSHNLPKENTPPRTHLHALRSHSPGITDINISLMDDTALLSMARQAEKEAANTALMSPETRALNKKKSQYYNDLFAYREPISSARERVSRDSIVMAELTTNVILKDEFTIITELAAHLSLRYQRSESSILVNITHSACLLLGGSFDPAYILTITALPSQIGPATNKRNSLLTAAFLKDTLGVPEKRGVIRFYPIPEDNYAHGGRTTLAEIEAMEQGIKLGEECSSDTISKHKDSKKAGKKKSMGLMSALNMPISMPTSFSSHSKTSVPAPSLCDGTVKTKKLHVQKVNLVNGTDGKRTPADAAETEQEEENNPPELESIGGTVGGNEKKRRRMKNRKSFMALFGKKDPISDQYECVGIKKNQ